MVEAPTTKLRICLEHAKDIINKETFSEDELWKLRELITESNELILQIWMRHRQIHDVLAHL